MDSSLVRFFDSRAKNYERLLSLPLFRILEKEEVAKILDAVNVRGKSVLDIGCGPGRFLRLWSSKGAGLVVGMDFSMEMLRQAKIRSSADLILGDCRRAPLKNDSFDLVSCVGVANYYSDAPAFLRGILEISDEVVLTFPQESVLGRIYRKISPVEIYLRRRDEVDEFCSELLSEHSIAECASGLTLVVRGRR